MPGNLPFSLLDDALRARLRSNLAAFDRHPAVAEGLHAAAVAIVLVPDEAGRAAFLLTRRAPRLRSHGGQWALPGGRLDQGESQEAAALRELREELGLALEPTRVLGLLDDYPTRSGFVITPVVVWGQGAGEPSPNPREVASVHRIPVAELARADVPRFRSIPESDRPVISIPLLGTQIHAPTAALLYQLVEVAFRGRDTRVAHFEQPVFAWR
jgi:8-oxo-dGTP pyrophosphatase MutT (NUDIX family)